jgi:hypothetical protein
MKRTLLVLFVAALAVLPAQGRDSARTALIALCDPAKIATLQSDRGANPRIRKIAHWLEVARLNGNSPDAEMAATMDAIGWGGTLKGQLTAAAMARNRTIAERLGCLDAEGMENLRRGRAPTIKRGPYAGEKVTVDHIIPRAVAPSLDKVLANLELMPHSLNIRKGAKVGQRQLDLANKLLAAGVLTPEEHAAIVARETPGYAGD